VAQKDDSVSSATCDERNRLLSTAGGGILRVRGSLDEPGAAKVNGEPAQMLAGNVFEATIPATKGTSTFAVEATDLSGNTTAKSYQVDVTGSGASYDYDANGNLIEKTEGSDVWTYEWNAENQLIRVTVNGNEVARFSYDPLGRRVEKVAGGVTTSYLFDGEDALRARRGAFPVLVIHGPGVDEPLARELGGALTYYHADGLGSTVRLTNQTGEVTQEYRYDAWGNLELGADQPDYTFTGRAWDPEVGLYYYRARYYEPRLGRFISEDPIEFRGGINFYRYVRNDPANRMDPTGLVAWKCKFNLTTVNSPIGPGAGIFYLDCKSDCIAQKRVRAKLLGSVVGLSANPIPIPGGTASGSITLNDPFNTPDAKNLEGHVLYGAVLVATPLGGYGYTVIEAGSASGMDFGFALGVDLGLDGYAGAAALVSSKTEECCEGQ
jgi:RHS repeat-associated protein